MSDQNKASPIADKAEFLKQKMKALIMVGVAVLAILAFCFFSHSPDAPIEKQSVVHLENKDSVSHAPQLVKGNNPPSLQPKTKESEVKDDRERELELQENELDMKRMVAPTQVYSDGGGAQAKASNTQELGGKTGDINSQFMNEVNSSQVQTSQATRIAHPESTIVQGAMIWATLETRISSDLPGMIRAVTSEDIYSEDGSQVLLPKGSALIGQYTNAISQGQSRVFVVWQRAIRPDHIDIQLGSTGTDTLGAAGIGADDIDTHFLARFGQAGLLSIIGAGASTSGVHSDTQFNSAASYREAISASFADSAKQSLKQNENIQPTISIEQGKKISVFVARDLDFSSALKDKFLNTKRNY